MTRVDEIAPEIFRISSFIPEAGIQFNQFLVKGDEPLLYHTGMKALFAAVKEGVMRVLDPATIRWIGFSHFEADECGALNEWLEVAPKAQPVCSFVGAVVSVNDFSRKEARSLQDGESFSTGRHTFQLVSTPHLPHCWEAAHLFEQSTGTLLCSDLLHQMGDVLPTSDSSGHVIDLARRTLEGYEQGPFAHYCPWTTRTEKEFNKLAGLAPKVLATMHGSTYLGDGARVIGELSKVWKDVLGH